METQINEAKGAQTLANQLTAELQNGNVVISGNKARVRLPRNSGKHTFKFHLHDNTNLNVRFSDFGAELGAVCPATPGDNTGQIEGIDIEDKKAEFTDKNSGDPITFGYTWFFTCDDPNQRPAFDPIVDNGGND